MAADVAQIKEHAFFLNLGTERLDFDQVLQKAYKPTFVPPKSRLGSFTGLNFETSFTSKSVKESVVQMTTKEIEDGKFEGFSYDADVSDSEALAALRRDSHSSTAWEQMARFSGSSGRFTLEKLVEEEEDEED